MYINYMNRLDIKRRTAVVAALVEGSSIRATARMTGVSKPTILKLLADLGEACERFHDATVHDVRSRRIQCDEIWSFVGAKQRNVPVERQGEFGVGDVWTWTAIDADSKLIVSWLLGDRDGDTAYTFISDLAERLASRVQLTTDGHKVYLEAVEGAFGSEVDYAMLIKLYGSVPEGQTRYSPAQVTGIRMETISGAPDQSKVSTSFVERQNLSMRMGMRRFTRLTNGFSKKIENHGHALALYFVHYNFARVHQTLRVTPAMEAGISDHVWTLEEVVGLLEANEARTSTQAS
jgi:IS1 family transposase